MDKRTDVRSKHILITGRAWEGRQTIKKTLRCHPTGLLQANCTISRIVKKHREGHNICLSVYTVSTDRIYHFSHTTSRNFAEFCSPTLCQCYTPKSCRIEFPALHTHFSFYPSGNFRAARNDRWILQNLGKGDMRGTRCLDILQCRNMTRRARLTVQASFISQYILLK